MTVLVQNGHFKQITDSLLIFVMHVYDAHFFSGGGLFDPVQVME